MIPPPYVPSSTILATTVISWVEPCIDDPRSLVAPGLQNAWLEIDWTLPDGWRNGIGELPSADAHTAPEILGLRTCPFGMDWELRPWLWVLRLSVLERREIRGDVKKPSLDDISEAAPTLACLVCVRTPDWLDDGWVFRRGVLGDLGWLLDPCMLFALVLTCCSYWSDFWWRSFNWSCISRTWRQQQSNF